MKYIIENATTLFYGEKQKQSFLLDGAKVVYKSSHFSHFSHKRLNTDQFVITPGHVMIDFDIMHITDFHVFKERMRHLHDLGCTTLITACEIEYEKQFQTKLKKAKHNLINSSIDFVVGARVPIKKLSTSLVRKCCRLRVPIIFVELNEVYDMYSVDWQWIRQELFPYHPLIVPIWNLNVSRRKLEGIKSEWSYLLNTNKVTTLTSVPNEHTPVSKQFLLNIGLYPKKGSLQGNCDADYLLFSKENLNHSVIDFESVRPEVVFANGKVKKAGSSIFIQPGIGKELEVIVPKQFVPINEAYEPSTVLLLDD
ncbi:hypothetical protein BKP35_02275 [Anaerobacillus arseniciselenatis]|uniref:Amidohydrolase-related domain-containing protein n=1 Tax=Anaerobacillus arseniciselenatis TaxID=85682 RepID=A0A1S2LTH1_9BACI|nr:hypothetical protein [Anaerobacillus arseniciselenatis]OIJ15839.1 hypothetical protein BKP35_02275 [Anaerobacillus arseniciselenatis]